MTGTLNEAPHGRPANATYEQPFIWQTPEGQVLRGVVRTLPGDAR